MNVQSILPLGLTLHSQKPLPCHCSPPVLCSPGWLSETMEYRAGEICVCVLASPSFSRFRLSQVSDPLSETQWYHLLQGTVGNITGELGIYTQWCSADVRCKCSHWRQDSPLNKAVRVWCPGKGHWLKGRVGGMPGFQSLEASLAKSPRWIMGKQQT